jgi:hypothetical protein
LQPTHNIGKPKMPDSKLLQTFVEANKQDINRILASQSSITRKSKSNAVTIEFGHIYTDETFTESHAKTLQAGSIMSSLMQDKGYEVSRILFVDNYNPESSTDFCLQDYLEFASDQAAFFDFVVYESDMQQIAQSLIEYFKAESLAVSENDQKLKLGSGSMLLTKPNKYACSLLDASFALLRMQTFNASALNVLDAHYKPQQRNVRAILAQINNALAEKLVQFYV